MKTQIIKHLNNTTPHKMSLDLTKINVSGNRVNIGIRCEPQLKIRLAKKADAAGVSLSSFAEKLLIFAEGQFDAYAENKCQTINPLSERLSLIEGGKISDNTRTIHCDVINTSHEAAAILYNGENSSSFGKAFWNFFGNNS